MDHPQAPHAARPRHGGGRPDSRPRGPFAPARRPVLRTIRSNILAAFLCLTLVTAALGWFSLLAIRGAGGLVVETYDLSLQSISYARAAAVDFAGMQAALLRRGVSDGAADAASDAATHREDAEDRAAELQRSLHEDLDIAASRARSPEAVTAAQAVEQALGRCAVLRPPVLRPPVPRTPGPQTPGARPPGNDAVAAATPAPALRASATPGPVTPGPAAARTAPAAAPPRTGRPQPWPPAPPPLPELAGTTDWQALDRCVQDVEGRIETLVEITAGDGFLHRQRALRTIGTSLWLDALAVLVAIGLSGLLTWLLTRRIVGPVRAAAAAAARIADGELETAIPQGREDELGGLLAAMAVMRDNIRAMMESEVTQRRSAQSLLVDAVESTSEGVVLVDRHGRIALANTQAAEFFPHAGALLRAGAPFARLVGPDLAMPDLAMPDLAMPDLAMPDLAAPDFAAPDFAASGPDTPGPDASGGLDPPGPDAPPPAGPPAAYTGEWQLADGRWLRVSRSRTRAGGFVEIYSDITELRARAAELERINLQFDAALSNMSQGLCQYDRHGRLQVANTRYREMFRLPAGVVVAGLSLREMIALNVAAGNHTRNLDDLFAEWTRFVAQRREATMCHELRDGRVVAISHQPTADGGWVATFEDITDRRRAEAQIMFMARHDALTSLPNRILFGERVQQALDTPAPPPAAAPEHVGPEHAGLAGDPGDGAAAPILPFAVMHLDLDHFKSVNDAMGHPAGDRLLQQVAQRLLACVGEADTVARLGGDEFAVVQRALPALPASNAGGRDSGSADAGWADPGWPDAGGPDAGGADAGGAGRLARRIVAALSEPFTLDSARVSIGVSIGIAVAPADGRDAPALLKNADMALYRAKAEGRSTARFFERSMDAQVQARRRLELDLHRAVEEEQFEVHYQPQVDLATGRIAGLEALLRWHHPVHGLVPPGDFIPIAEEVGLIVGIGEWVLTRACREAARWPQAVSVAVNVSPAQFRTLRLVEVVAEALSRAGLAPGRLELEITETVLLRESEAVLATLHQLRARGVRIAMDDFGTGYSSLSYLRSFPFDKIKIDQSFVRDMARNADSLAIVRAAIGLGASLGMKVAAEGVETSGQVAILRAARCDQVQGFLYSRPCAASAVPDLLALLGHGDGRQG